MFRQTKELQWRIQDFSDKGRRPLSFGQKKDFCRKLHENERNWTERGSASLASTLISINELSGRSKGTSIDKILFNLVTLLVIQSVSLCQSTFSLILPLLAG